MAAACSSLMKAMRLRTSSCVPPKLMREAPRALMRALVEMLLGVGEEVDAADEEGEVHALAVAIHFGGEIRPFLPALELGAIVEGDGDELRRALHGGSGLRADDAVTQRTQRIRNASNTLIHPANSMTRSARSTTTRD